MSGQLTDTKSLAASRSANGTTDTPSAAAAAADSGEGSEPHTIIPAAAARTATARPMPPSPTMPSVAPRSDVPGRLRPRAGVDAAVDDVEAAGEHHEVGHRDVGDLVVEHARRVGDDDAAGCCGGEVDAVDADAPLGDHAQVGAAVEDVGGEAVVAGDHPDAAVEGGDELVALEVLPGDHRHRRPTARRPRAAARC